MSAGGPVRARRRGRALGGPLDPRPAGVPGHEPHRRAGAGAADLPRGRPRRVPDPRPVAGRARPASPPSGSRCPGWTVPTPPAWSPTWPAGRWRPSGSRRRSRARRGTRCSSSSSSSPRATGPARCRPRSTSCSGPRVDHLPRDTRGCSGAAAVIGRVASVPLLARTVERRRGGRRGHAPRGDRRPRRRGAARRQRRLPPSGVPRGGVRRAAARGAGAPAPGGRRGADP